MTLIKLHYSTIDRFSETRTFKTLAGARAYFARKIGTPYDLGSSYAVDMFGTGKLEIRAGTTWAELLDRPDPHGLDGDDAAFAARLAADVEADRLAAAEAAAVRRVVGADDLDF